MLTSPSHRSTWSSCRLEHSGTIGNMAKAVDLAPRTLILHKSNLWLPFQHVNMCKIQMRLWNLVTGSLQIIRYCKEFWEVKCEWSWAQIEPELSNASIRFVRITLWSIWSWILSREWVISTSVWFKNNSPATVIIKILNSKGCGCFWRWKSLWTALKCHSDWAVRSCYTVTLKCSKRLLPKTRVPQNG